MSTCLAVWDWAEASALSEMKEGDVFTRLWRLVAANVACSVLLAAPALGQLPSASPNATSAAEVQALPAPAAAAPAAAAPATLVVTVTDRSGTARNGVVVRLRRPEQRDQIQLTDASGRYTFDNLSAGTYTVQLLADDGVAPPAEQVTLAAGETVSRVLTLAPPWKPQSAWTVAYAVVAYLVALLFFRFFTIAQPSRKLLAAQIESMALKLRLEAGTAPNRELAHLIAEIDAVRESQKWSLDEYIREPVFWSGGRELTAWRRIHEVERHLISFMAPSERVFQRAVSVEAELRALKTRSATALADRLRRTLNESEDSRSVQVLRHQLAEALSCGYGERDSTFSALMEWHNKAMWMVTLALMVIGALSLIFGQVELFLLGAAGGLMSRMTRSLLREDLPTDYGASWTTLFLSPLLGAIAAWFGIAAIDMLGEMQVFGGALGTIAWGAPVANAATLFTAFLLGFSERLFMSLLTNVEGRVQGQLKDGPAADKTRTAAPDAVSAKRAPALARANAPVEPIGASMSAGVVEDLDLTPGERVVFVGDATSPLRLRLHSVAGAANVVDVALEQIATAREADAIMIERAPDAANLAAAAAACAQALRPDGRLVVVGSTPAGLYDADSSAQATQGVVGPAFLLATVTAAGLLAQEPPERLAGPDPVRWSAAFRKPEADA